MKLDGKEESAIAEIMPPGLAPERLVHTVRIAWGNALAPGMSQNRIACLGWERIEAAPEGWKPLPGHWSEPVLIWAPLPVSA